MAARMARTIGPVTATSASWKVMARAWRTTRAPILINQFNQFTIAQCTAFQHAKLVEQEVWVAAVTVEMPVLGVPFLIAMGALRGHHADRGACERDIQSDIHINVVALSCQRFWGAPSQHDPVYTPHSVPRATTPHIKRSFNAQRCHLGRAL